MVLQVPRLLRVCVSVHICCPCALSEIRGDDNATRSCSLIKSTFQATFSWQLLSIFFYLFLIFREITRMPHHRPRVIQMGM